MFYKTHVSMDITGTEIRVISVRKNKVRKWKSVPLPEHTMKDGIIIDQKTVSVIANDLFRSMKLPKDRVISTVTGLPFIYRVITMPRIEKQEVGEALERAARREIAIKEEDMYLLWQAVTAETNTDETSYLVIGIPKTAMRPFLDTMTGAGIKPYMLDVKPLALARVVSSGDSLIACLEKNYIDIIIVSKGLVRVMHGFGTTNAGNAESIVNEFADGLSKAVNSFNRDYPHSAIHPEAPLFLSGELSSDADVLRLMQEISEHPIHVFDSPLVTPDDMPVSTYASNLGLILKKLRPKVIKSDTSRYNDINLNLLSTIYKPFKLHFKWSYAIIISVMIVLAALLWGSYTLKTDAAAKVDSLRPESNKITEHFKEEQKANKEVVAARKEKADSLATLQELLKTMKDEHQSILGLRYDYASDFNLIVNALPAGMDFKTITMTENKTEIVGEAKSALDVLTLTETLDMTFSDAWIKQIEPTKNSDKVSFIVTVMEEKK